MSQVLIVEADQVLGRNLKDFLIHAHHRVSLEGDAQSAINEANKKKPDIVVLDLQLASHSGIEFLYEFRSYDDWSNIPIIVLGNVPQKDLAIHPGLQTRLGISHYFYKPKLSMSDLAETILQIMQSSRV